MLRFIENYNEKPSQKPKIIFFKTALWTLKGELMIVFVQYNKHQGLHVACGLECKSTAFITQGLI
jgi:hypothetical protein